VRFLIGVAEESVRCLQINALSSSSDKQQNSPCNIIQVMAIKEKITCAKIKCLDV